MKKNSSLWVFLLGMVVTLSSCQVVGGIFKAGVGFGIAIVVIVIILILWLVSRGRK